MFNLKKKTKKTTRHTPKWLRYVSLYTTSSEENR